MNNRLRLAGLLVFLAASGLLAGQNPPAQPPAPSQPPPQPQQPTFRVRVDYVEVDVVVTDRQGNLVRDLKKEDFQVLEDGKGQTISTFTQVDIPVERADRPLFAESPIEPDVKTNETPFDGRVYVMVIDDLQTDFSRTARTKAAARLFIQQRMGANDIMAVIHTAGPDDASQEFTTSKRLLLAAVDRTFGRKLQSATLNRIEQYNRTTVPDDHEDIERAQNAQATLRELREIADWFSTVRGRRKAILFVSEGIDYDITQVVSGNPNNLGAEPARWASSVLDATRDTVDAAMRSNVSIFSIDPRGLVALGDADASLGSLPDPAVISPAAFRDELRLSQDSLRTLSEES